MTCKAQVLTHMRPSPYWDYTTRERANSLNVDREKEDVINGHAD